MNSYVASPILVTLALVAVQVLFGVNYVVSKVVVNSFPPLAWANFRAAISAIVLVGACYALKRKSPVLNRRFFLALIPFSLLGVIINQSSFLIGLSYTTSTNSAVLNTLIPIFTLIIVTLRGQEPATFTRILGFVSAFIGVLIMRKVEDFTLSNQTLIGDLLTMLNCLSYACFLSFGRGFIQSNDRMWTTAWLFIYGSVGFSLLAARDWMTLDVPPLTPTLLACMFYAIIGGTLLTYFLNNWALAYAKSSQVALYIYTQPIVAALLAWAWLGEAITLRTTAACIMIFVGMLLGLTQRDLFGWLRPKAAAVPPSV